MPRDIPYPHPGEILREEFFVPMGLSVYAVAKAIGVPRSRLNEICRGKQGITASIALKLARFFDMDPRFFMNLQTGYELETATEALGDQLDAIEPVHHAA
jgi:addiction module HigA family antidote